MELQYFFLILQFLTVSLLLLHQLSYTSDLVLQGSADAVKEKTNVHTIMYYEDIQNTV